MAKILLVEDDKSLREIYGVRLMAEGYQIVSAGDGEEALALAIKERPDLIVSDVMMPKISGFDMLDILRSTTETKDVKVIMMTALSSDDQRARGEALGADRYLVKSQVGIEDVVRTVHDVLGDGLPGVAAPVVIAAPSFAPTGAPQADPAVAAAVPAPMPMPATDPAPVSLPEPVTIPSAADLAPQTTAPATVTTPVPTAEPTAAYEAMPTTQPVTSTPEPLAESPMAPQQPMQSTDPAPQTPQPAAVQSPAVDPLAVLTPITEPVQVQAASPAQTATPAPAPAASTTTPLPQPTAPFSSPAPASLGQRIIEPLTAPTQADGSQSVDISTQMEQALNTPVQTQPTQSDSTLPPVQ